MQLQVVVTKLAMDIDQMISGLCKSPCNIKQKLPMAIIINAGREIPSVLRVRIVVMACGK